MPYITEKLSIGCPFMDRRTKLLPCQKEMVLHYHKLGYSQRVIAKMFNVSRRLIVFIIYPEKHEKNYQARLDKGGSKQYYDKNKNSEYKKTHRRYKQKILKNTLKQK